MTEQAVGRRQLLAVGLIGASGLATSDASAQQTEFRNGNVLTILGQAQREIFAVTGDLVQQAPGTVPAPSEEAFVNRQADILVPAWQALDVLPATAWTSYVIAQEVELVGFALRAKLRLCPDLQEFADEVQRRPVDVPEEDLLDLLLDILLDTLGIGEAVAKMKPLLKAQLREPLARLAEAVAHRNLALTALAGESFFGALFSPGMLDTLGKDMVVKLLKPALARLTPFLGWGVWVASLLLAIHHNWPKIVRYVR